MITNNGYITNMIYLSMGYYGIKPIYKPMVIMGRDNSYIYILPI